jgi:superfamily II DNA helicase RecQ
MTTDFDDEFGLDEDDEQALQALADADDSGKHERKHARNESGVTDGPPTKVLKTNDEHVDNVALDVATDVLKKRFKLPGFRLKQSLAISRILNGGSSVVVFPTGEIDTK